MSAPPAPARTAAAVAAAGAAGLALVVAHPPLGWWWAAWLVAPLLVVALRTAGPDHPADPAGVGPGAGRAVVLGLVAGAVGYGVMLHWIAFAGGAVAWVLLAGIQAGWVGLWALLAAIERWVTDTGVPVVEIAVNADNPGGVAFLEASGYRPGRILMVPERTSGAA